MSGSARRAWPFAVALVALGGGLVVAGALADGYLQSACLEVGAATLLVSPLLLVERRLGRLVDLRVEDGVAKVLNAVRTPLAEGRPLRDRVAHALAPVPCAVVVAEHGPVDYVVECTGVAVAVVVPDTVHPIDAASLQRLVIATADRPGRTGLVVVTEAGATGLAQDWLDHNAATARLVRWTGPGSAALLEEAVADLTGG